MGLAYEGKVILAHHHDGNTPYLLVTFIGLYRETVADTVYLMQDLVERENISCVGITTRIRSFYLHDEMNDVAALVRNIRQPDQKVIVVGQSSAGFAAVKFANLLEADYVLAFSPIFSAHEADLNITENMPQELAFLRSAVRIHRIDPEIVRPGMRPGPEDCSAMLFVMFDPAIGSDSLAAHGFARLIPQTRLLRCTDFGHEVFERIYDEQGHLFAAVLKCLGGGEDSVAYSELHRLSRRTESAIASQMVRIARWRPWMVEKALQTNRVREALTEKTKRRHPFNDIAVFEFVRRGRTAEALKYLHKTHPALFGKNSISVAAGDAGLFVILSYHGDLLTYDSETGRVVMTPQGFFNQKRVPLLLDTRVLEPRLVIQLRNSQKPVLLGSVGIDPDGTRFEVVPIPESGVVAFRRGTTFLTADYAAEPAFTAPHIQAWEWFAPIPVSDPAVFANTGGLTWFDQVQADHDNTVNSTKSPLPKRTSFRSRLQQFFN